MDKIWIKIVIGCAILGLLTACVAAKPDWVDGKSKSYSNQAFLTGVGFDKKRTRAEDRARAEIAKIFQVNVQARNTINESSLLTKLGDANREEYSQSATSTIETSTDKMLHGVQIAELYTDEKSRKAYALATLDRARASRGLREELASIDSTVRHLVGMAEENSSPLVRLAYYLQAVEANKNRAVTASDLTIVSPAGWATPTKYRQGDLVASAEKAAKAISVSIELDGDDQDIVDGAIVRALNDIGMKVVASGANVSLRGRVDTDAYERASLNWVVASAQVEFVIDDNRRLDSVRTKAREGTQVASMAESMAYERLGDKIAGFLVQRIGKMGR